MKRTFLWWVCAAALTGAPAYAGSVDTGAVLGGMLGGGVGTAVGSAIGGRNGAIVGGALGGGAGAAIGSGQSRSSAREPVYREEVRDVDGHGWSESYAEPRGRVKIPPGHLPPPGSCRIWYPGRPPGHQPPPGSCSKLSRRVPPGAVLVRG